jgi:alkanesulfonate monooxygenase SsuD/methylene tetrahydromethanopterin reductase-like flavin-dependent oxidoreductase (luciferase family)
LAFRARGWYTKLPGIPKHTAEPTEAPHALRLFHNLHDLTQRDYADLLDELRELAAICDETDFDVLWMPEHHFSVWGRELLPNPLMTAVDLAARTKRIRIGLAAAIVTFWHPLRAAEDIALLDQLTGGRVEIGFGRGNYGLEASNLNPDADPNDQARNKLVFDEAVSVIKAALTQERFSFKGKVYEFPAPGSARPAHTVRIPNS